MNLGELEARAASRLDPLAWGYISRGAGDDVTREENEAAWRRLRLRPHVLRDVSSVKTTTSVLGTPVRAPILVAPMAMHRFCCEEGEVATARAAAAAGTVMCVSMASTRSFEDVVAAAPGSPRWAQMYMLRDRGRTKALALGARAVMIGRPVLWGLAVDGEAGAAGVLDALTADLRRTMAFCGAANVDAITRDLAV